VKSSRWGRVLLLFVLSSWSFVPFILAQGNSAPGPPQQMRVCAKDTKYFCETLTWSGDHYDAVMEGDPRRNEKFRVVKWGHEISLDTSTIRPDGNEAHTILNGQMAATKDHIENGKVVQMGVTVADFTATWTRGSVTTPAAPDLRDSAPFAPPHRSKTHPNILLAEGADEMFASFPDDIRAVLLPAGAEGIYASLDIVMRVNLPLPITLSRQDALMPCDIKTKASDFSVQDAGLALEIGKFALRRGEYARGFCWINQSGNLKNHRAFVIMGVIHLMGWGVPVDKNLAYRFFDGEYRSGDPWAAYFLEKCYREGIGTKVSSRLSDQIQTSAFLTDAGQQMLESIGSDDLEKRQKAELDALMSDPSIVYQKCTHDTVGGMVSQYGGHCESEVNQALLEKRTKQINDKYAAIE
jgi:hypothetical protein